MTPSWASALLLLLPLLEATGAAAEPVTDARSHFAFDPSPGSAWDLSRAPEAPSGETPSGSILTAVHSSGAASAAIVRINYPNTPAWRQQKHYFADVTRGLKEATPGFVLERSKQTRVGRVPVLDVSYRRSHETRPQVATRFVFFRTFTLIISVTSDRPSRRLAERLATSLVPKL